ncbi:MAG TPA: hypothetical protein VGG13_01920 [Candidatus Saccharimonadales bacterium]|jgi:hypothetical protein
MSLSIEDLEAIKAIVREVVRDESQRAERRQEFKHKSEQPEPAPQLEVKHTERPQEIVANIRRASAA